MGVAGVTAGVHPMAAELRLFIRKSMRTGEEWRGRPALAATVRLFNAAFFRKVITRHDTGMGESYMDGDWEVCKIAQTGYHIESCPCRRHSILC